MGGGGSVSLTSPLGWAWIGLITVRSMCVTPFLHHRRMAATTSTAPRLTEGPRPATVSRRTDALVASVGKHHRAISAHQSQLLTAVAELDRRKAWRVDGATSMVSWLVQRCSVSASTAREWVTAAGPLQTLPKISDALAQGKLSFDQVKPLVDVAKPESDAKLAEEATHWTAKQVRELATAHKNQSDEQAAGAFRRRFLRFNDQRRTFSGCLPDDQYAIVKGRLTQKASRHVGDRTPFDQRMADALHKLCAGEVANGTAPTKGKRGGAPSAIVAEPPAEKATRPTVVVHADLSFLAGASGNAELDLLGPISREVVRRLACDAKIILSADDAKGHSIQQGGARRSPTPQQRLEIRRRDKGCRYPGCTYTEFTDVHHVIPWPQGGPTDIPNLVTLCDAHHRAVHEFGWQMAGDANVELTFKSPTGRITTSRPSPTFTRGRGRPPD
jgi:uncharacterized protein DUF222/HNH endonuclease